MTANVKLALTVLGFLVCLILLGILADVLPEPQSQQQPQTTERAAPIENVQAIAIFSDANGDFITSADALIDYRPILPGQSSPFKVMKSENPAMKSARMEFKQFAGGELKTYHNWK